MFDSQYPLFCHGRISHPPFCKLQNIIKRKIINLLTNRWKPLKKSVKWSLIKMHEDGMVILFFFFRIQSYVMSFVFFTSGGRCGLNRMVVGFTTIYAISAYHHRCCEFESRSRRDVQHYVIKFVIDSRQVGAFLRILRFPPPIKLTATI